LVADMIRIRRSNRRGYELRELAGIPIRRIDLANRELALADPDPLTLANLTTKSLTLWIAGISSFDCVAIWLRARERRQAAYAAPLILLAQTRQADRDAAHALADAEHREALHSVSEERAALAANQTTLLVEMLQKNTQLTEAVKALTERVETLTSYGQKLVPA
jgi:hypothetical protein